LRYRDLNRAARRSARETALRAVSQPAGSWPAHHIAVSLHKACGDFCLQKSRFGSNRFSLSYLPLPRPCQ